MFATPGEPVHGLSLTDPAPCLVGRDRERATLRRQLDAALDGRGGLVLIAGEAGIGKTALAERTCREAAGCGAVVLSGRCFDLTGTPAYGLWLDLFARFRAGEAVPPPPAAFATRGAVGAADDRVALIQEVVDFFGALTAARTAVVLLEDLHWADPASIDVLRFLVRTLHGLPLLVLATYRDDEMPATSPMGRALPSLVREAPTTRLALSTLPPDAVHALVTGVYGLSEEASWRLARYLHERSEGNPFFAGELLRALEEEGTLQRTGAGWTLGLLATARVPSLLRRVIEGRAAWLSEESRRLLAVAAVIGQEMRLEVWAAVAGVGEESLLPTVEHADAARLLEPAEDGAGVRFVHALIRETLYEGILPPRRRALHRAAGEALAAAARPNADAVASHFQRAGDDRAVAWLLKAGDQSQAAYAWTTAAERYEQALALMERRKQDAAERGWLLRAVARLRRYTDPPTAVALAEEALTLGRAAGDRALIAASLHALGVALTFAGRLRAAMDQLAAAADAAAALNPDEQARIAAQRGGTAEAWSVSVRAIWMMYAGMSGHLAAVLSLAEGWDAMDDPATSTSPRASAYAHGWYGLAIAHALSGDVERAEGAFERALAGFQERGDVSNSGNAMYARLRHLALPYRADHPGACERWAQGAADAFRQLPAAWPGMRDAARAPLDFVAGRWYAPSIAELAAVLGARPNTPGGALPAQLARERGEMERAWEQVRAMLADGPETQPGDCWFHDGMGLQRTAALLSLDAGDLPAARAWLAAHDRWLAWSGAVLGLSEGHALWAQYYRQSGDMAAARDHAERARVRATEPRQPLALLAVHRLLGELDTDAGRFHAAARHLEASLQLADACHAPYERALSLLALAELRAVAGERDTAAGLLDEVHVVCEPLGAKPAIARAEVLASRLARASVPSPTYPDGLTAREVGVLRLIAVGKSNRQIADALSISERTVNRHITNLYTKIDAHSKADATAYAFRHRLT